MITKEQATQLSHGEEVHFTGQHECCRIIGKRGGVKENITKCRISGAPKLWKRDGRFRIPVKYGLYENGYIDQDNCEQWHLAKDCPLNQ